MPLFEDADGYIRDDRELSRIDYTNGATRGIQPRGLPSEQQLNLINDDSFSYAPGTYVPGHHDPIRFLRNEYIRRTGDIDYFQDPDNRYEFDDLHQQMDLNNSDPVYRNLTPDERLAAIESAGHYYGHYNPSSRTSRPFRSPEQLNIFSSVNDNDIDDLDDVIYPTDSELDQYSRRRDYKPSFVVDQVDDYFPALTARERQREYARANAFDEDAIHGLYDYHPLFPNEPRFASVYIPAKEQTYRFDLNPSTSPIANRVQTIKSLPGNLQKKAGQGLNSFKQKLQRGYKSARDFAGATIGLDNPVVYQPIRGLNIDNRALGSLSEYGDKTHNPDFGFSVSEIFPGSQHGSMAFQGPGGYFSVKDLKRKRAILLDDNSTTDVARIDDAIKKMEDPLYAPMLRYALGHQLDQLGVGSEISQTPLEGDNKGRDLLYTRGTKGVLKSTRGIGHAKRLSKDHWKRMSDGAVIQWDPNDLKTSAILKTFNPIDKEAKRRVLALKDDHSKLKQFGPQGGNINKPSLTYGSPAHRLALGRAAGTAHQFAEHLFPSPETVRKFYQESPKSALENHAVESITSLPVSATVALGAAVLPGVAPLIPGAGLGLGAVSLGETADAISRQQTGEGLLSKIQQFIGTRQRTGTASDKTMHKELTRYRNKLRDRGPDEAMSEYLERSEPVIPTIQPQTYTFTDPLPKRVRMAADRFNPSRGEFGLSEILFGR
tara:strand:- start:139 stop:2283 length:2145 start_codon:yes stop_codon:yes gene_type:complete